MNEDPNPPAPAEKPGLFVRAFLIILPVGLAFMVPISLWIYYQKKNKPAPATSLYAAMLRRELNSDDFARYTRILLQDIGERSLAKPDNLAAASAFIESTMGSENMGYTVQRQSFKIQDKEVVNLVAELPGQSKPNEVVLVLAEYDGPDVSGIAALMCVAHALTGTEQARTIRFAAVLNANDPQASANGVHQLADADAGRLRTTTTLIPLSGALKFTPEPWKSTEVKPLASLLRVSPFEFLASLKTIRDEILKAANAR